MMEARSRKPGFCLASFSFDSLLAYPTGRSMPALSICVRTLP